LPAGLLSACTAGPGSKAFRIGAAGSSSRGGRSEINIRPWPGKISPPLRPPMRRCRNRVRKDGQGCFVDGTLCGSRVAG
jgi:hypothetical protein